MPEKKKILSEREYALLVAIEGGAAYGLEILARTPKNLFGPQTVYIYLKRSEQRGLVRSRVAENAEGRDVRAYALTAAGRRALAATRDYYATV